MDTQRTGMDVLDPATGIAAETGALANAIRRAADEDAASLPLFDHAACMSLVDEARSLAFRPARPVVGVGETAVYQDFDLATEIPDGRLTALARGLGGQIARANMSMNRNPLPEGFAFNDLIVQRYAAGSAGISPHRDHIRYVGLVAIVVLAGTGRFFVSRDRNGRDAREVPAPPGHILLMRAPGFNGRNDRPFHAVREIEEERYILGLRHDSRPATG